MSTLATSYTISPSNDSTIAIEVAKTGLERRRKHTFFFDQFRGEMRFAENDPSVFQLTLTVDTASAACRDPWLKERKRRTVTHFARTKILASNLHPEIRFTSKSLSPKPLRGFVVAGALQIRDTTQNVRVNTVFGPRRQQDWIQLDGDFTLRLTDFALPRPSALFGLIGTKDEALIRLLLWAIPQAQSA